MKLFNTSEAIKNLLPYDGNANYYGVICHSADHYYERLMHHIAWKNDEAIIFGKHIYTKRKIAWYGDLAFEYSYSGIRKIALPWTSDLLELKELAENASGETFNSCLLNLYHNGSEGMAWHSDAEKDLKPNGTIASLTFGAQRKFSFKHKIKKEKVDIYLEHGSLLVMKDHTQSHWLHRLPPTKTVSHPRINLTFRTILH